MRVYVTPVILMNMATEETEASEDQASETDIHTSAFLIVCFELSIRNPKAGKQSETVNRCVYSGLLVHGKCDYDRHSPRRQVNYKQHR